MILAKVSLRKIETRNLFSKFLEPKMDFKNWTFLEFRSFFEELKQKREIEFLFS